MSSEAGYEPSIFYSKPPDSCFCPLCLNIMNDPRQCSNGHCFCCMCITNALNSNHSKCPVCKVEISRAYLGRNLYLKGAIEDMPTFCISCKTDSSEEQCPWIGKLEYRETHFELECGFRVMICDQNGCSVKLQKRHLDHHKNVDCLFRQVRCEHCDEEMAYVAVDLHQLECKGRLVKCQNGCDIMCPHYLLSEHENVCTHRMVECPLWKLGLCVNCSGTVSLFGLKSHICDTDHLFDNILSLASKNVQLGNEIATVRNENCMLKERLDKTMDSFTTLMNRVSVLESNRLFDIEMSNSKINSVEMSQAMALQSHRSLSLKHVELEVSLKDIETQMNQLDEKLSEHVVNSVPKSGQAHEVLLESHFITTTESSIPAIDTVDTQIHVDGTAKSVSQDKVCQTGEASSICIHSVYTPESWEEYVKDTNMSTTTDAEKLLTTHVNPKQEQEVVPNVPITDVIVETPSIIEPFIDPFMRCNTNPWIQTVNKKEWKEWVTEQKAITRETESKLATKQFIARREAEKMRLVGKDSVKDSWEDHLSNSKIFAESVTASCAHVPLATAGESVVKPGEKAEVESNASNNSVIVLNPWQEVIMRPKRAQKPVSEAELRALIAASRSKIKNTRENSRANKKESLLCSAPMIKGGTLATRVSQSEQVKRLQQHQQQQNQPSQKVDVSKKQTLNQSRGGGGGVGKFSFDNNSSSDDEEDEGDEGEVEGEPNRVQGTVARTTENRQNFDVNGFADKVVSTCSVLECSAQMIVAIVEEYQCYNLVSVITSLRITEMGIRICILRNALPNRTHRDSPSTLRSLLQLINKLSEALFDRNEILDAIAFDYCKTFDDAMAVLNKKTMKTGNIYATQNANRSQVYQKVMSPDDVCVSCTMQRKDSKGTGQLYAIPDPKQISQIGRIKLLTYFDLLGIDYQHVKYSSTLALRTVYIDMINDLFIKVSTDTW